MHNVRVAEAAAMKQRIAIDARTVWGRMSTDPRRGAAHAGFGVRYCRTSQGAMRTMNTARERSTRGASRF